MFLWLCNRCLIEYSSYFLFLSLFYLLHDIFVDAGLGFELGNQNIGSCGHLACYASNCIIDRGSKKSEFLLVNGGKTRIAVMILNEVYSTFYGNILWICARG